MPDHKGYIEDTLRPWPMEPEFNTEFCDLQLISSAGPPEQHELGVTPVRKRKEDSSGSRK